MTPAAAARPTRPLPCRRSAHLVPWLLIGVSALVVLGGASAWSAFGRAPDALRVQISLPAPPTAGAPAVQGIATDQNRVVVAPRPTAVRESVAVAAPGAREASPGQAAETVPVAAPPPDDPSTCSGWVPAARRPTTCPPAPPGPPRDDLRDTRSTR
jgi:hypothetical protein